MTVHEQHRGLKPLEGLCCMARCDQMSQLDVAVRFGGRQEVVRMCREHAAHHAGPVRAVSA